MSRSIAAQLAHGVWWSLFTIAGIFVGIELLLRRERTASPRAADEALAAL